MKLNMKGVGIALVTPFAEDGSVDYTALERLIQRVIAGGADYLVALGTTAETPTLSGAEREEVLRCVLSANAGRLPVILGMGGNNTAELVQTLRATDLSKVDAILSV
ncbi:MAG: dihydrodipicolinate synthase family protein, partial [Alistipes sp.]|nr:dihydrodipicolinate synthase family protein [Alistipes sp.]